jgi:hypothetical protein
MVETFGIHQMMCLVVLKSAKYRVLGVDTPGQQVLPWVRYRTACLLMRAVVGCVPCLGEWENWCSYLPRLTWCKRGRGTTIGVVTHLGLPRETLSMMWYCVLP